MIKKVKNIFLSMGIIFFKKSHFLWAIEKRIDHVDTHNRQGF